MCSQISAHYECKSCINLGKDGEILQLPKREATRTPITIEMSLSEALNPDRCGRNVASRCECVKSLKKRPSLSET